MNDLIKRSDAIDELMHIIPYKRYHRDKYIFLLDKRECLKAIRAVPTADRPKGEWIENDDLDAGYWHCSVCKTPTEAFAAFKIYPFCPFCGAKMKGINDV